MFYQGLVSGEPLFMVFWVCKMAQIWKSIHRPRLRYVSPFKILIKDVFFPNSKDQDQRPIFLPQRTELEVDLRTSD